MSSLCCQVRVRFHRQDSSHSLTSRASSRTKRDEKRRDRHVTNGDDDAKLPFPLEVSQSTSDKLETTTDPNKSNCSVDLASPEDEYSTLVQQAKDTVNQGVANLEKVIRRLKKVNKSQSVENFKNIIRRLN